MWIIPSYSRFLAGLMVLLCAFALGECRANASEPPPLIGPMEGVVRDVRRVLDDSPPVVSPVQRPRATPTEVEPRHHAQADGPMCFEEPEVFAPALCSTLATILAEPPTEAERIEVAVQ
ncbi:hypothetical protein, partial [Bradyrhizobium sp. NBAIM08]|uniref:hypothetical protein n=1 Tax=Bradyrhizobium sp. NBAIM08 TaxID=2793815 RepID=UPI001CD440ED